MKTLIFDVYGEWAHFRAFYTTSSPVSFSVMPPSTACGVIGAILGLDKTHFNEQLQQAGLKISVGNRNEIKKLRMGINLIKTNGNQWFKFKLHTQIRTEFLRDPKFRIYTAFDDMDMYYRLKKMLTEQKTYYTVSLGLSELLASFEFIGEMEIVEEQSSQEFIEISSIIPADLLIESNAVDISQYGAWIKKERYPVLMNNARQTLLYRDFIFDSKANSLRVKVKKYYRGDSENIIFSNF